MACEEVSKMKHTSIVLALLVLGLILRFHNYAAYPQRGATSDEYAFAFSGISLLTGGVPIGWSAIPLYNDRTDLTIDGLYFPLVRPYLDHPPLFSLLVGAWEMVARETTFQEIRLATMRVIPVTLSLVASIFLYALTKQLYRARVALWSLAIYATATIIVVNSRIVVAESLLTLIWLAALWFVARQTKRITWHKSLLLGALCATAILTKALGIVVWLSVMTIMVYKRVPLKHVAWATVASLGGLFAWYLYGSAYDETLFWAIQSYQGTTRVLGPKTIWMLLGTPSIVNTMYYDGWYFWGMFALGVAGLNIRKNLMIVLPAFVYLLLIIVSVNEMDIHGWYLVPLFPFLAVAGGKLLVESIENSRGTLPVWATLVGAYLIQSLYATPFGLTPSMYRWLVVVVLVPAVAVLLVRSTIWRTRLGYGMTTLFLIGTAIATVQYVHPV